MYYHPPPARHRHLVPRPLATAVPPRSPPAPSPRLDHHPDAVTRRVRERRARAQRQYLCGCDRVCVCVCVLMKQQKRLCAGCLQVCVAMTSGFPVRESTTERSPCVCDCACVFHGTTPLGPSLLQWVRFSLSWYLQPLPPRRTTPPCPRARTCLGCSSKVKRR